MWKQTKVKLANLDHLGSVLLFFLDCLCLSGGRRESWDLRESLSNGNCRAAHSVGPPSVQGHSIRVSVITPHSQEARTHQYMLHFFFVGLPHREFFGQGWMKNDKNEKTPYIMRTTKHFNDVRSSQKELLSHIEPFYPNVTWSLNYLFLVFFVRWATLLPRRSSAVMML